MSKTAFIFPGQGAQYTGMGKDFYENFIESRQVFEEAERILNLDMKQLVFVENEKLNITEYTQAAMITTIAAMISRIHTLGIRPDVCAGLSLGEYAALIESEVLSIEDAIRLVRKRGIYMQEAVPLGIGMMAAVLGLENSAIEEVLETVDGTVSIANYNCPGQTVISGEKEAVFAASAKLTEAGAKRVIPLNVSGPFHSAMLADAGEKLAKELDTVAIHEPKIPYIANVTADYVTCQEQVAKLLEKQVSHSVRWQQTIEKMIADGVTVFVEIGPGKTLASFVKKIDKTVTVINIDKVEDLEKLKALQEEV